MSQIILQYPCLTQMIEVAPLHCTVSLPKSQPNDVKNIAISDVEHHGAKNNSRNKMIPLDRTISKVTLRSPEYSPIRLLTR